MWPQSSSETAFDGIITVQNRNLQDDDDDAFRISPNIFMGLFALSLSFLAYLVSSTSFGKRSVSHAIIFTGLLVLNPSEKSLKNVSAMSSSPTTASSVRPRLKNSNNIRSVSGLELTCKAIRPGDVPLFAMTAKKKRTFLQWQALDAAVCIWIACLIAVASPCALAWYIVFRERTVCCDNLKCWLNWWRSQLGGAGLIYTSSPPPNSMLVILTFLGFWFLWRLVVHSTRLQEGIFRFSPNSYINGWITLFSTIFLFQITNATSRQTGVPSQAFLGIPLNDALEEWSARVTLWIGLTGFYSPENESARERVFLNIFQMTQLLFASMTSLVAFALADPLRETMRLYWVYMRGDAEVEVIDKSKSKLLKWLRRQQMQYRMISVAFLPIICWSTYFLPETFFQRINPLAARALMGWFFIWTMIFAVRPLLQMYLLQALPAADHVLETIKKPAAEEILFPFQNRHNRLLSLGGQLLIYPAFVLLILSLGHGAGQQPTAMSGSNTLVVGIYPFSYYQSVWTNQEETEYQEWEEFQAKSSAQRSLENAELFAELSTTRANIGLCQTNASFSFLQLPEFKIAVTEEKSTNRLLYSAPIYRVASPAQLLARPLLRTTFVRVLRKLQRVAQKTLKGQNAEALAEEAQKARQDLYKIVCALAFHPLLTSTIILPVLDFLGLLSSSMFLLFFIWYATESSARHRHRYGLLVKGESCRVVSVSK